MYLVPPACLAAGLLLGYLVHNPKAEQTTLSYEQAFRPRVEHLKHSLAQIMDRENDMSVTMQCSQLITLLDRGLTNNNPDQLVKNISKADFTVDWYELKDLLLKLNTDFHEPFYRQN